MLPGAVQVSDEGTGTVYQGTGGSLAGAATVQVALGYYGTSSEPGTLLSVTAESGIYAVDDHGFFHGASSVPLPFP